MKLWEKGQRTHMTGHVASLHRAARERSFGSLPALGYVAQVNL